MPRQARLIVPDVSVHIVQRGHDRRDCFRQEADYLVYLASLRDLLAPTGCELHAYCLMTNHVHLLLTPRAPDACALLMRSLGQRYVQYFNRRYDRRGTLWEGRFRSCLVDSASYVLACYRYIELNPVRAGMVARAAEYRWSSHEGNAGRATNKLLTPHAEHVALGSKSAYQGLFDSDDDPTFLTAVRDATNGGFALVGESTKARLPAAIQQRLARRPPGPAAPPEDTITADLGF